ncbi:MAG: hypothetical protein J0I09_10490 [Sphingobacteriia bacterium]|nr:hypothetical protein [Sphingobacteriia bacterium]
MFKKKRRLTPKDDFYYKIAADVVEWTISILRDYGNNGDEGLLYWAGAPTYNNTFVIDMAIAPHVTSSRYGFQTNHEDNGNYVECLMDAERIHFAQVHSHPRTIVDHSWIDDTETAFKSQNLLSIVVPSFGEIGMVPLEICGIHRFNQGKFFRLSNRYIKEHFEITNSITPFYKDLR